MVRQQLWQYLTTKVDGTEMLFQAFILLANIPLTLYISKTKRSKLDFKEISITYMTFCFNSHTDIICIRRAIMYTYILYTQTHTSTNINELVGLRLGLCNAM